MAALPTHATVIFATYDSEEQGRGELVFRVERFLRGGDHSSFNAQGFAAIRFVEPVETFAHQHQNVRTENGVRYGDLQEFMDFDYLARVQRLGRPTPSSVSTGARPACCTSSGHRPSASSAGAAVTSGPTGPSRAASRGRSWGSPRDRVGTLRLAAHVDSAPARSS